MEARELFNMIQNPIDDPKVIEKLITAYANESKGLGGFYGQLTKTVSKEYTGGQFPQEDANKFYAMLFNKWKNSIVNMTRDEFVELYKKGSYDKNFIKMRNYLKNVPDVSTMKEANNIFFGNKNDSELQFALEKYRWSAVGEATGWVHVYSRDLTAKKDPRIVAEHRLYLDTESPDTYKMVTYFVEKCDKYHLPYYFKFDQMADRDDTIVIYSSSETLTDYVNILQEIKKEHPELISRVKEPPLLTGKIDGWIGYGSEPQKTPDGKRRSFNEIRSKVIEPIIEKHTKNWIMAHLNMQVTYKGQQLSFQNYIALKSTEFLIEKLETKYSNREETMKNFAKKNGSSYNPQAVVENLGYTLQDLKNPQFQKSVYNIMVANFKTSLPKVCNGNYNDMSTLLINVRNGKQISFPGSYLEETLQSLLINITKNDPTFLPAIQNQIRNSAPKYGIDPNNFCFDIAAKNKLENIASKNKVDEQFLEKNRISKPVAEFLIKNGIDLNNQLSNMGYPNQIINEIEENPSMSENTNVNNFDVQTITEILNPTLMERKMKLPNGMEIPAKQYIQEIVYPHLPENGLVILSNGSILPVKQFIEECVMFECQEKYNGDFPRYMAEKTKNNLGVVSLEYGNETYEINPVEITEYIGPELLEKRIKLPNGVDISARQYIQEVFAPYIPSNGRITLSNGIDISAKQYIEEILLLEAQEKYNGDIVQILYNTTRNNVGTINTDPIKMEESLIDMRKQTELLENRNNVGPRR